MAHRGEAEEALLPSDEESVPDPKHELQRDAPASAGSGRARPHVLAYPGRVAEVRVPQDRARVRWAGGAAHPTKAHISHESADAERVSAGSSPSPAAAAGRRTCSVAEEKGSAPTKVGNAINTRAP